MSHSESEQSEINVVDSHSGGEPTRVVIGGGPPLGSGPSVERVERFRNEFDHFRTGIVTEPRGSDLMVGALLCTPNDPNCLVGVIFFNNVGYLGMCGHGMISVVETLKSRDEIGPGESRIETPVGVVTVCCNRDGSISVANVDSYRVASDVKVDADGVGTVVGDVAYGGSWFFLAREPRPEIEFSRIPTLRRIASSVRRAVNEAGYPEVDHVALFGEPHDPDADARNFVLCPGFEYDRSPSGTGTCATMAGLAADGKLHPNEEWIQEGILGTTFTGSFRWADAMKEKIRPVITGRAYITSSAQLRFDASDPFRWGTASRQTVTA